MNLTASTTVVSNWLNSLWEPVLGDRRFEILRIHIPGDGSDLSAVSLCCASGTCHPPLGTLPATETNALVAYLTSRIQAPHKYLIGSFEEVIAGKTTRIKVGVHDYRRDAKKPTIDLHVTILEPELPRAAPPDESNCECWPHC